MYKIVYEKSNGQLIERIRTTLPHYKIGEMTSMGWIIKNIQYNFNNNYYDYIEYRQKVNKAKQYNHMFNNIRTFIKKYSTSLLILVFIPLYLLK